MRLRRLAAYLWAAPCSLLGLLLARLRAHEQVHVRQYQRWGVLFLLAYPAASLWLWLRGRRPYRDNPFEVEARRLGDGQRD